VLAGFEAIDAGRRVLGDPTASAAARRTAEDRVWAGNVQLRRLEADAMLVESSLARIIDEARAYLSKPCLLPHPTEGTERRRRWRTS
jgi:hypothetical protein